MAGAGLQGDLVTRCLLNRRGVQLTEWPGLVGNRIMDVMSLKRAAQEYPMTYHYMTPGAMHWLHVNLHGGTASQLDVLEKKAFTDGCCCWWNELDHQECLSQRKNASILQLHAGGFVAQLRDLYVAEWRAEAARRGLSKSLWTNVPTAFSFSRIKQHAS